MFKISVITFLILQIKTKKCGGDTFSAMTAMEKLIETQTHVIEAITAVLPTMDDMERDVLNVYLAKLKKEDSIARKNPAHYVGNPINSYALICRLFRDLHFVERILNKTFDYRRNSSMVYPTPSDFEGANAAFIYLSVIYGLKIHQLADGILIGRFSQNRQRFEEHVSPLSAQDCFDLAKLYYIKENRRAYIAWLKKAYIKYKTDYQLCQFTDTGVVKEIAYSYSVMEEWNNTIYWMKKYVALNSSDVQAKHILKYLKEEYSGQQFKPKPRVPLYKSIDIDLTVMRLCRYESGPIAGNISLYCYYAHGPHPFLLLAPMKAEILNRGPDVTMFYDIVSEAENIAIKDHVTPKLSRATVYESYNETASLSWTSQVSRVSYDFPEILRVLNRVEQISGLKWSYTSPDRMIVGNYGIAGYFSVHVDFFYDLDDPKRMSSTLFYLSDVEQGGATIFTMFNLTVFPVKNAALFWYNLDDWGTPNFATMHASCPVVRGTKWMANKWTAVIDQDLSRPSPLHPPQEDWRITEYKNQLTQQSPKKRQ